jgi:hypothetical protein
MTPQEIFDTVVNHLRQQGARSVLTQERILQLDLADGTCAYRAANGYKCAAGALIQDEEYAPEMEGKNIAFIIRGFGYDPPISLIDRLYPHLELINKLQRLHDAREISEWENTFREIATDHNLIYTPPLL